MKKIAVVTQSYRNDFNECRLLCESMDRFAPELDHFIFVNDEDAKMFACMNYGRHKVYKKSVVIPWYFVRVPFKVYDAVFNIDSETVFMKPFDICKWIRDGKYIMYRTINVNEPSHDDYCRAVEKLLKPNVSIAEFDKYNYMNTPVCFVRENTEQLLKRIKENSVLHSWKLALCNTYRFSEYYTYGSFTDNFLNGKNHIIIQKHLFPQIDISDCGGTEDLSRKIESSLADDETMGLWLQKKDRKL